MITTEQAFDMLPTVVILYDKLDIDGYRNRLIEENKGKKKKDLDIKILGTDIIKYILKNSYKVKEEVFEVVAIFEGKEVKEIKAQSFIKTINTVKEIFSDKDAMELFKSAI